MNQTGNNPLKLNKTALDNKSWQSLLIREEKFDNLSNETYGRVTVTLNSGIF